MTFVGDKGGARYPSINRARLVSGETYLREGPRTDPVIVRERPGALGEKRALLDSENWWQRGGHVELSTTNQFGLKSRSETLFPEAYKPIDTKFWVPLSAEERAILVAAQAAANLKATFSDDEDAAPLAHTSADEQYAEAQSRRYQAIRRRKKPRNYDERKKEEALRRKDPLQRRSSPPPPFFRESQAIVSTGPLDTPILVQGLPTLKRDVDPTPRKLRGGKRIADPPQVAEPPVPTLPEFSPLAAPKARLIHNFTNNPFGLKSMSERDYPEAYRDLSSIYWRQMSEDDRQKIMTMQARAMERVGYEAGTAKRFIEEIEPADDYVVRRGGRTDDTAGGRRGIAVEDLVALLIVLAAIAVLGYSAWDGGEDKVQAAASPVDLSATVDTL